MEMKTEKEIIIDKIEESKSQTILLSGGWGFGKTTFAKNELTTHFENKEYIVFYLDSRIISLQNDMLEYIAAMFNTILSNNSSNKEKAKKVGKKLAKGIIWGVNGFFNKSFDIDKIFESDDKDKISKKIEEVTKNKKVIFIVDELDRNDGYSLLKILNFINLIAMQANGNSNFKIIGIGNLEEISEVIRKSFGYTNEEKNDNEKFMNKYFGEEININTIWKNSVLDVINKYDRGNEKSYKQLLSNDSNNNIISAREVNKWLNFFNTKETINIGFIRAFLISILLKKCCVSNLYYYIGGKDAWGRSEWIRFVENKTDKIKIGDNAFDATEIMEKDFRLNFRSKHMQIDDIEGAEVYLRELQKIGTSKFDLWFSNMKDRKIFI